MKPKTTKPETEYQRCVVTFSDKSVHSFTGKVAVRPGAEGNLRVVDIAFTHPKPLPDGMTFTQITEKE